MVHLTSKPISTDEDVEVLRELRNITTAGFSSFNGQISTIQQHQWWSSMQGRIKGWLYSHDDVVVGFGVLRESDGTWWNSIGVDPLYQGLGIGSFITHDLLTRHAGYVYATVRRDNIAGIAMHHSDDWEEIDGPEQDRLIYLRSRV